MIAIVKDSTAPRVLKVRGKALRKALCNQCAESPDGFATGNVEFKRSVYAHADVKSASMRCQYEKCAFCESKFSQAYPGDIEHFRPKSAYRQSKADKPTKPGYYWLAYEWSNLLWACSECNNRKGTLFPLEHPAKRAKSHKHRIKNETPMLIDPSTEDPTLHIRFRDAVAYPVNDSLRGESTIGVLALNRAKLVEDRLATLNTLKLIIKAKAVFEAAYGPNPNSKRGELLREFKEAIAERLKSESEYASMTRSLLNAHP